MSVSEVALVSVTVLTLQQLLEHLLPQLVLTLKVARVSVNCVSYDFAVVAGVSVNCVGFDIAVVA